MTKIIIAVLALSVLGVGIFVVTQNKTNEQVQNKPDTSLEESGELETFEEITFNGSGTFRDLLALGTNVMCTISYTPKDFEGKIEGTVYVSGENMRADFFMSSAIGNIETSVINTGDTGYTWGTTPMGEIALMFETSTNIQDTQAIQDSSEPTDEVPFNMDENISYTCERWSVDKSKFVPPSDINFVDFKANLETQMQAGQANINSLQCNACNNIPDASAQAQCKATLGCS